jgi:NAD(P)-dependent dehydrogenase (short-subunit alcohol dehydrogenase family)
LARTDQTDFARQYPGRFFSSACDVSDWPGVAAASAAAERQLSHVDALITCAGTQGAIGRALALAPEVWSDTVRTNIDGTYFPIRAFWPLLAKSAGRRKIVCFSGGGATKPRANFSAYAAAKTAIVRLVETLATEESASGVDINAVAPGAIHTAMTDDVLRLGPAIVGAEEFHHATKLAAAGRTSDPTLETAMDLVEWLLSPASDSVTGRLISAQWDPWRDPGALATLTAGDACTVRRVAPRGGGEKSSP